MRIRSIKPEFWRSDDITGLSREDRLLFIGLWSYVDDNGVGIDDYRAIAADLFALEDDQKDIRDYVREGLATLSRGLLITRYEVGGKRYLHITKWKKHQRVDRPNKARYPEPTDTDTPATSDDADSSRHPRDTLATPSPSGTEEQRNRGRKTPSVAALPDPDWFSDFYAAYPRKVERRKAEQAWKAALKRKADPQQMIAAAKAYADRTSGTEARFVKHPSSWLNAGAYEDEQPRASVHAALSFEDLRARGAARDAARLIRASWSDPNQPMSDETPYPQWLHARAVEWIDAHEQEIRAALTERKTG